MTLVRLIVSIFIGMIGLVSRTDAAEPMLTQRPLFIAGLDGVNIYRIPSLITTQEQTALAFCEAREAGDKSPTDLVVKRSFDNGRTWQAMQTVCRGEGGAIMNPTPVVDRSDGTVLLACNLVNRARGLDRIWILKSADDGASWSEPVDITESVGPVHPGPGRGISLKSGRLVIPGRSTDKHGQSLVVYSDDHGKTWKAGAGVAPNTAESQVVELADGRLMINMRSTRGKGCRSVAISRDGGKTWDGFRDEPALPEPVCQGTIVRYTLPVEDEKNRILFANPARANRRTNMAVKLSYDEGETWPVAKILHPGPSAYSCLTVLSDGTIGLLYEGGSKSPYESIVFAKLNLEWLTDCKDHLEDANRLSSREELSVTMFEQTDVFVAGEGGQESPYERISFARFTLERLNE